VLDQLRETETEIARASRDLRPAEADLLAPVGRAARAASERIRAGDRPSDSDNMGPLADDLSAQRAVLTVLVLQGVRLAEEDDPAARADCVKELAELDGLLRQANGVLSGLEQRRDARGAAILPRTLTGDEQERVKELEKTLRDLDRKLKSMKNEKPFEREKARDKGRKDDKREREREREDDDDDRREKSKGKDRAKDSRERD
jgi:hypothetical protein